tara:strand:- start:4053 stop:4889 length:837 start_codon:yes stop_codon:yes gene_type:complete
MKTNLHVCFTGLHPEKNFNNIKKLISSFELYASGSSVNVGYSIIYDPTQTGLDAYGETQKVIPDNVVPRLLEDRVCKEDKLNLLEYQSGFFKTGEKFSFGPPSLIVQNEPVTYFCKFHALDNDYIFKVRSDVEVSDYYIKKFLDCNFYEALNNNKCENKVFDSKVFIPYIGPEHPFDFCDYFFLGRAKNLLNCLPKDYEDAIHRWHANFFGGKAFTEKFHFLSENLIQHFNEKNSNLNSINHWDTKFYWSVIKDNFEISFDGRLARNLGRPVLDKNKK